MLSLEKYSDGSTGNGTERIDTSGLSIVPTASDEIFLISPVSLSSGVGSAVKKVVARSKEK